MKTWARGGRGAWAAAVAVAGVGGCTALLGVDEEYQLGSSGSSAQSSSGSGGATACVSGSKQCAGDLPQLCDANGAWQNNAEGCLGYCNADVCVTTPSCSSLPTTCGPSGNESCCAITAIPGGTYNRSNDASYPATVSDFRLDRFEITVGRFRQFMAGSPGNKPATGAGAHPKVPNSGWQAAWNANLAVDTATRTTAVKCNSTYQTWTDQPGGNEQKPMNCLDWYEAFAFCAWDGGRLPTEAEWNYAAAGGNEQRLYPWGAVAADKAHAVYECTGDGSAPDSCAATDIVNTGSRSPMGDGRWGQADLAGSVWEWNMDWHGDPYAKPCSDCAIVAQGTATYRVVRGGGWGSDASTLLSSVRNNNEPTYRGLYVGARCARTP